MPHSAAQWIYLKFSLPYNYKKVKRPFMGQYNNFGIVLKSKLCGTTDIPEKVTTFLRDHGKNVFFANKNICPNFCSNNNVVESSELIKKCDIILVFGGDGTLLSIGRLMKDKSIPIVGVNMGHLGFLAEIPIEEIFQNLEILIDSEKSKNLKISERKMLQARVFRDSKIIFESLLVNDAVITKHPVARIFNIEIQIDEKTASFIRGDGVIISTPTGSTAYSLAAGGPILSPDVEGTIITPICPHSLTLRPMVVKSNSKISCIADNNEKLTLSIDGQLGFDLNPEDRIEITTFENHKLKIVMSENRNYFEVLRSKLRYGSEK